MKDKTLLKLSLAISIAGMIALFVLTETMEAPEYSIADALKTEGYVKISGTVKSIRQSNGISFLKMTDNSGEIDVIMFEELTGVKKGSIAEVSGKVSVYNGKKQLEADKIIPT